WAPLAAAWRTSFSALAILAARSQEQAIWVAATVTMRDMEHLVEKRAMAVKLADDLLRRHVGGSAGRWSDLIVDKNLCMQRLFSIQIHLSIEKQMKICF